MAAGFSDPTLPSRTFQLPSANIFGQISMAKVLIVCEKPSVATDIAKAIGGMTRNGDYFEGDEYVLSSAVGHLLEISVPEEYEVKRGKWSLANLPVIPPRFDLSPIKKTIEKLNTISKLIKRKDISHIINACDAGREGELIFRLIIQYTKAKQPIQRLWLQSMTSSSIIEAFKNLRRDEEMLSLADAARCRAEADWLVGINGTRAMTAFNSRDGGFYLTTVGRVQTPTLTIVVEREENIKRFKPKPFFEIIAKFEAKSGIYSGKWIHHPFKKDPSNPDARADRIWSEEEANRILEICHHQPGIVKEETKPVHQAAPALFDLTSLQREANAKFGFSAKTTLSIAQTLYERRKVLTYPRTDAKALPEDYVQTAIEIVKNLSHNAAYSSHANEILSKKLIKPDKRVFNNKKISDHFAIIPTTESCKIDTLSDPEKKIYNLVCCRFMAIFFPAAEYLVTTRITEVKKELFKTDGRILTKPGWLSIYGREETNSNDLVPVEQNEQVQTVEISKELLTTKPPPRYTDATLLSAMESAGKLVEDTELREVMAEKGLGTPATRASIIEGLIKENYLIREAKDLLPTTKAFQLLTLLRGLGVTELTEPELTGEWEFKLREMERGRLKRADFMNEISEITRQIVQRTSSYESETVPGDYASLSVPCPICNGAIQENYKRFACTKCDFSITKIPGGRQLEVSEAEILLKDRSIGPLSGFRSRMGRPFSAILRITNENKLEFDFGQENEEVDFSGRTSLGTCPKCSHLVFENGMFYICEKSVGHAKSCDFRSGRFILQKEILPEQMEKLLLNKKTDLLVGFISSKSKKQFKAFLVINPDGNTAFEFEEKKPSKKRSPKQK